MNSGAWFQCHIYSSLWGTPQNPFAMQLSSASHGTETTLGWRWVARAMASNVGILHASVRNHFGQAEIWQDVLKQAGLLPWDTDPQDLYLRLLYVTLHRFSKNILLLFMFLYTPALNPSSSWNLFPLNITGESSIKETSLSGDFPCNAERW